MSMTVLPDILLQPFLGDEQLSTSRVEQDYYNNNRGKVRFKRSFHFVGYWNR